MKRLFYWFFRLIFGLYFILYGIKGLSEMNNTKVIALSHLNIMKNFIEKYISSILLTEKIIPNVIFLIKILNLGFIYGGLIMSLGFKMGKWIVAFALSLECFLLGSMRIHIDELDYCSLLTYLSLIGVVLIIKN